MKVTDSLEERLFVMYLNRELEIKRLIGEAPDMRRSVEVASRDVNLTVGILIVKEEDE